MAFAVSTSLGHAGVVGKIEDGSYIGLRQSTTRKLSFSLCRIGVRGHTAIRASEDRSTAGPQGTPKITPLDLIKRPRRNRKSPALREAFQETHLSPANFVLPLFIHEGEEDTPIGAMPGCFRLGWRHGLLDEVYKARDVGINSFILFPKVPDALKVIYTDVALDPYNSDGHDGIVREDGVIMNDETVHQLCKQAVSQARAGADVVSPSDMMDGRVAAIRAALDAEGFHDVSIMSYTAKYASAFYGPFREALDSNPRFGDKRTYQMNPANFREALIETYEDVAEGADILLVKPALPYLDVVRLLRQNSALPIAAYQVSGEYSMIKAGAVLKMIDEEKVMMESLMCIKRAGADVILTYFARQAANVSLRDEVGAREEDAPVGLFFFLFS
ncbi:unnamed protein product [Spirodela intermedia]|uniref:Delta-aminolevulinic acid dehydratase n=1 Tax=Spirodela intermedia TaxID=51605 RepID=A0A7I8JKF6_SPIIN|nr:unnamed protein product [Spirodela intermedia]CAA6670666.1 unnamed protein product [Spirodela intermedia]